MQWAREVDLHASQHMGVLAKALSFGVLKKTNQSDTDGLNLGSQDGWYPWGLYTSASPGGGGWQGDLRLT